MFNQSKYLSTPTLPHTMTIKHSNMMDDILTEFITYAFRQQNFGHLKKWYIRILKGAIFCFKVRDPY